MFEREKQLQNAGHILERESVREREKGDKKACCCQRNKQAGGHIERKKGGWRERGDGRQGRWGADRLGLGKEQG